MIDNDNQWCQLWILKSSGIGCDLWMLEVEEVTAWCKEKALAMPRLCTCTDSPCALDSRDTDKRKRNQFGLTQHIQIIQQYSTCWSSGAIHLIIMVSSRISSRILSEERNYIYMYSAETFCASKSFVSAALQGHQGAATDTLGVAAIVPPTISCPSNTPKTQSRKPRDPKCYSMNPHEEQKTLWW